MTKHTKPLDAEGTGMEATAASVPVDVSPEAIAALVAEGASALGDVAIQPDASPDALPLLVGITHDLRSPLSSMLVLIERLRAGHAGPLTPPSQSDALVVKSVRMPPVATAVPLR